MANALSHAIGAQTAFPDRQVVALAGDGGLAMLLGELMTVAQHRLPVKIVVFNNSSLNFIELEMKAAGFVTHGTGLQNPSFAAVAEAMGVRGVRVERSPHLRGALEDAFAHDGPVLIDVVTERDELSIPPKVTAEQVKRASRSTRSAPCCPAAGTSCSTSRARTTASCCSRPPHDVPSASVATSTTADEQSR